MSLLALFITIGRELLPFLKEALLEGQTFRAWIKTNWLTFAWLINTLILTMMIAHLSDMILKMHSNEKRAVQFVEEIQKPISEFVVEYRRLEKENLQLEAEVKRLDEMNAKYEYWLADCGIDELEDGKCKVVIKAPIVIKPKTQPRTRTKRVEPTPQTSTFIQRMRDMLEEEAKAKQ